MSFLQDNAKKAGAHRGKPEGPSFRESEVKRPIHLEGQRIVPNPQIL